MNDLITKINDELVKKFEKIGYDKSYAYISISGRPELADYQINSCFNIAKEVKSKPLEVASIISKEIKDLTIDGINAFSVCEESAPGFVNIKLSDELLIKGSEILYDDNVFKFGNLLDKSEPKCILLDYGGANVAKPLHVGHLRVAVIGEALKRLYNRLGIKTISDVHLGDFGLQMGLVIEELKDENKLNDFTISDLEIIYPKASLRAKGDKNKGIESDKEFNDRAHASTLKLQNNIEPETSIWKKILQMSIDDLKIRYGELNVNFDYYYGESTVKDIMEPMVDDFIKRGIAYESDTAFVVDVKEPNDKKEMPPCIIRKSDGAALYATSDIATIKFREEKFDADEYVYVVDKRQSLHLESCFRVSKKAGILKRDKIFKHVAVGTMNGTDGKPFKSRDGGVVKLETLITDAMNKALEELKNNNRDLTGLDENVIAKNIAIAALKYGDLSNSPTRDYVFDINKFLSFQGNTGPYILYTIVRIKSIFEKIGKKQFKPLQNYAKIDKNMHDILVLLQKYSTTLLSAYKEYDPSAICKYIFELSNYYNSFYHEHNIINETDNDAKQLYINISIIVDKVLRDALNILAIDIPDKM